MTYDDYIEARKQATAIYNAATQPAWEAWNNDPTPENEATYNLIQFEQMSIWHRTCRKALAEYRKSDPGARSTRSTH